MSKKGLIVLGVSLLALALCVVLAVAAANQKKDGYSGADGNRTEFADGSSRGEKQPTAGREDEKSNAAKETAGTEGTAASDGQGTTAAIGTEETENKTGTPASGEEEGTTAGNAGTTGSNAETPASGTGTPKPSAETPAPSTGTPTPSAGASKPNTGGEGKTEPEESGTTEPPAGSFPSGSVEEKARYYISQMTLEEKVAGLFFVHPEVINGGLSADGSTKDALSRYPVGGVIYFANNIQSEQQLTDLLSKTREYSKYPLFLGVDEEGGRVARVAQAFDSIENTGDAASLGSLGDPTAAYRAYAKIGGYLGRFGFNVDFAPVADIYNESNSMFERRSFGKDAKLVSEYVSQAVRGLQDNGVSACAKHFPGHGSTKGDSHNGLAVSGLTMDELLSHELLPFQSAIAANTDFIMMGHISLPNVLSDQTPATLSYEIVTGILRGRLHYNGIIITDAMRMSAVAGNYSSGEASVMAIKAGCDMILMPDHFLEAYQAVLNAAYSGEISVERIEESLMRIYRVKCRNM